MGLPSPTAEQRDLLSRLRQEAFQKNFDTGQFGQPTDRRTLLNYDQSDQWPASVPYYEALVGMMPKDAIAALDRRHNLASAMTETSKGHQLLPGASRDAVSLAMLFPHYDDTLFSLTGEPPIPGPQPPAPPAFTYQFNLNADKSAFPDLLAPVSRQEPHLRRALLDAKDEIASEIGNDFRPIDLYGAVEHRVPEFGGRLLDGRTVPMRYRESSAHPMLGEFESALLDRGIPGIRYADQGSRRLPFDSPSRTENFVVYDPSIMELVKRYPYAVLLPMLMSQGQPQEQSPVPSSLAGTLLE
jgi:hypothetical protein